MRVNTGRLDLKSLNVGEPCIITTGGSSIKLVHTGQTIEMGLYLTGVGMQPLADDRLLRIEHVKGFPVYWLHLGKLAPRRLYTVLVTSPPRMHDEAMGPRFSGMPGWQISDDTPGSGPQPGEMESGGRSWNLLGKLLGRRGD
ncbi:hypothetical protein SEA_FRANKENWEENIE_206 [Streptomyces phage Frankenweenie]|nr:hypothetical protein SEA_FRANKENWEENIE_206 [Streptomyces phage Frankenweenie]